MCDFAYTCTDKSEMYYRRADPRRFRHHNDRSRRISQTQADKLRFCIGSHWTICILKQPKDKWRFSAHGELLKFNLGNQTHVPTQATTQSKDCQL